MAEAMPTEAKKDGGNYRYRPAGGAKALADLSAHERVDKLLQIAALPAIAEDNRGQGAAVDLAVGAADLLAKAFDKRLAHRALHENSMADRIRFDRLDAEAAENGSDRALAGAGQADKTDHQTMVFSYLASSQLQPSPISATIGTSRGMAVSISRFTSDSNFFTSAGGDSKTNSSWICKSRRLFGVSRRIF